MLKQSDILKLYEKYNVKASKRFGQNFLIDQNILKNILKVADIKGKDVIEIGPGLGSLTHFLLDEAKSVTSYEIDNDMIKVLKGEINSPRFVLIEGDFLKTEIQDLGRKTVVANIPYNITSDILFKLFEMGDKVDKAVIMMQKEVAQRLSAPVGSKQYGKLSITANFFSNISYEFTVPASAFLPSPKVESAVVSFKFKNKNFKNAKDFLFFVKGCFSMRRKTLNNNLKGMYGPEKSSKIIKKMGLSENIRPQGLTLEQYEELFAISIQM